MADGDQLLEDVNRLADEIIARATGVADALTSQGEASLDGARRQAAQIASQAEAAGGQATAPAAPVALATAARTEETARDGQPIQLPPTLPSASPSAEPAIEPSGPLAVTAPSVSTIAPNAPIEMPSGPSPAAAGLPGSGPESGVAPMAAPDGGSIIGDILARASELANRILGNPDRSEAAGGAEAVGTAQAVRAIAPTTAIPEASGEAALAPPSTAATPPQAAAGGLSASNASLVAPVAPVGAVGAASPPPPAVAEPPAAAPVAPVAPEGAPVAGQPAGGAGSLTAEDLTARATAAADDLDRVALEHASALGEVAVEHRERLAGDLVEEASSLTAQLAARGDEAHERLEERTSSAIQAGVGVLAEQTSGHAATLADAASSSAREVAASAATGAALSGMEPAEPAAASATAGPEPIQGPASPPPAQLGEGQPAGLTVARPIGEEAITRASSAIETSAADTTTVRELLGLGVDRQPAGPETARERDHAVPPLLPADRAISSDAAVGRADERAGAAPAPGTSSGLELDRGMVNGLAATSAVDQRSSGPLGDLIASFATASPRAPEQPAPATPAATAPASTETTTASVDMQSSAAAPPQSAQTAPGLAPFVEAPESGEAFGAPLSLPAGLFGSGSAQPAAEAAEGEVVTGTDLATAARGSPEEPLPQASDHDRTAGPRHVHDRDVVTALGRRLLEERERMGGFGALIR